MEETMPWSGQVDVISDDSSSSDKDIVPSDDGIGGQLTMALTIDDDLNELQSEDILEDEIGLCRRAKMYQEYMEKMKIPVERGSAIPFTSWVGLGRSIKQLYRQPLHYLTNILLNQWDQLRMGSANECKPLDFIVHPCKAEATVWLIEEVHRSTTSYEHIANLWQSDPMHHAFVDSIFPDL